MHGASHAYTAGLQGRGKRLSSAYAWRQSRSRLAMCADSDVTSPGQSRSRSDSAFRHVPRRVGPRLPERTTPSRRGGATSLVQHVLRGALVQLSRRLPVCACASREREGVKERASEREGGGEGLEYGVFERDTGERGGVRRAMRRADSSARRHLLARSHGGGSASMLACAMHVAIQSARLPCASLCATGPLLGSVLWPRGPTLVGAIPRHASSSDPPCPQCTLHALLASISILCSPEQ